MKVAGRSVSQGRRVPLGLAGVILALACLRFCHVHLLWADEDYHLAGAVHILHGKIPYRDFWYDKPPLSAAYYLLIGGSSGWPLRALDALYVLLACYLIYRLARCWWGAQEGWTAALLLAFFTTFYLPSAVIPFAADALMIVPHLAAIHCARRKQPLGAGLFAGISFLVNTKGLFVLAVCAVWLWPGVLLLAAGFALPVMAAVFVAVITGTLPGYIEQVWRWGLLYAAGSPVSHPLQVGFVRTANWLGFHAALAAGAVFGFARLDRRDRWKLGCWLALSFAAVCLGTRFAPHYYLQVLPGLVLVAARGIQLALREFRKPAVLTVAALLAIPLLRFGPRYVSLARDNLLGHEPRWTDVVMDLDSQDAARRLLAVARPTDTLFVWGYRPDLYVYTRMTSDSRFWDSQPLTGVPADRHLSATNAIYGGAAGANRRELAKSHPVFVVDGLSLLNPSLAPGTYLEMRAWLGDYALIGRTKLCLIYRRKK